MTDKKHSFKNDSISVSFDGSKCAHAGICFGELKQVFDGDREPPIDINAAPVDTIVSVVEKCPSSALTYQRYDDKAQEKYSDSATATIIPGGPLAVRGTLQFAEETFGRLTFCRCGQSNNKPFCDGSHKNYTFDNDGISDTHFASISVEEPCPVNFKTIANGPLFHNGNLIYKDVNGNPICQKGKAAICRCGASKNKPFCDGSHTEVGFTDA